MPKYEGKLNFSYLCIPEVGEKQLAQKKRERVKERKKERKKASGHTINAWPKRQIKIITRNLSFPI